MRHFLQAWSEGCLARQCNKPEDDNPYLARGDLVMALMWQKGWNYRLYKAGVA